MTATVQVTLKGNCSWNCTNTNAELVHKAARRHVSRFGHKVSVEKGTITHYEKM